MSVEKRNDGYRVRWRDEHGRLCSRQVQRYKDALKLDGELKRRKATGELAAFDRGKETLAHFGELWYRRYALSHLTPKTRENYAALYDKHVLPALGHMSIRAIRPYDVEALSAALTHSGLAPATVRKCLVILQGMLQRAVVWEFIDSNPAAQIKKPTPRNRVPVPLSPEQVAEIRSKLDRRGSTIVAVLAGTGIRPGELRGLEWLHVGQHVLLIEQAVSMDVVGPTKTGRHRAVLLPPELRRELLEWHLASDNPYGRFVFPGRSGGLWTDDGWRQWQRTHFRKAAPEGVVAYDLRHTWVSQMIRDGCDIHTIAAQAGHAPTETLNRYGHLFADQRVAESGSKAAVSP